MSLDPTLYDEVAIRVSEQKTRIEQLERAVSVLVDAALASARRTHRAEGHWPDDWETCKFMECSIIRDIAKEVTP